MAMCGIAGVLGQSHDGFAAAMQGALRHRGPDGEVSWATDGLTLVQTRLAIIDLSDEGTQPFHSHDKRFTVTYNGEIYNHEQLRKRHGLSTGACDGSVLPDLWAKLGPACLAELRGMFAICAFDRVDRRMWLAVDPLGMKPLYVREEPGGLAFASEAMPLALFFGAKPEADAEAMFEAWGCLPAHRSGIEGIQRMPPGEVREFDGSGRELSRSGIPLQGWRNASDTTWSDVVDAFVESVDLHLMSDVPIGLMLSAGVDSAAIAWAAAEAGRKLDCFTLDFAGSPREGLGAAQTAKEFGHSHRVLSADPDVRSVVANYLAHVDRPTCDGLNMLLVSRAMRAAGIKVALTGTGGDELLVGYTHHQWRRLLGEKANASATWVAKSGLRFASHKRGLVPGALNYLGRDRTDRILAGLHGVARGALSADPHKRVAAYRAQHPEYPAVGTDFPGPRFGDLSAHQGVNNFTAAEWQYFLAPMLLADADVFSMAAGVEARLPFVDVRVVAAALQVSDRSVGKQDFVGATGDARLAKIASQPKAGFELPMGKWLSLLDASSVTGHRALPRFREARRRSELGEWKGIVWSNWASRLGSNAAGQPWVREGAVE